MSGFGKRVDGPGGRRQLPRRPVAILGSAMTLEGSQSVIVEDLGPRGARLVGRRLPPPGREIMLRAGKHAILGRVAWADRDHRGMIFEAPLANTD